MEICGIIAEYNPFHNGHLHQLKTVREKLGPKAGIVAAMSGDFTQRGEPAILDKWTRARTAVRAGADVVLELPFAFATASAERFAAGGVALLNGTGVIRHLSFGAEEDSLETLQKLAGYLAEESDEYRYELKNRLTEGIGFAAARQTAVRRLYGEDMATVIGQPNAILGLSYLIAAKRQKADLTPLLVLRQGPGEHSGEAKSGFAPASLIRKEVIRFKDEPARLLELSSVLPDESLAHLIRAALQDRLGSLERVFPSLLTLLRTLDSGTIAGIASMAPDLDKRLLSLSDDRLGRRDADAFIDRAATRAYPASRVRRALMHLLIHYRASDEARDQYPQALRVLAFGKNRGRYILKLMRRHATLPILSRTSDILEQPEEVRSALMVDLTASDIYALSIGGTLRTDFDADTGPV